MQVQMTLILKVSAATLCILQPRPPRFTCREAALQGDCSSLIRQHRCRRLGTRQD